jgi:hypothetical protein
VHAAVVVDTAHDSEMRPRHELMVWGDAEYGKLCTGNALDIFRPLLVDVIPHGKLVRQLLCGNNFTAIRFAGETTVNIWGVTDLDSTGNPREDAVRSNWAGSEEAAEGEKILGRTAQLLKKWGGVGQIL